MHAIRISASGAEFAGIQSSPAAAAAAAAAVAAAGSAGAKAESEDATAESEDEVSQADCRAAAAPAATFRAAARARVARLGTEPDSLRRTCPGDQAESPSHSSSVSDSPSAPLQVLPRRLLCERTVVSCSAPWHARPPRPAPADPCLICGARCKARPRPADTCLRKVSLGVETVALETGPAATTCPVFIRFRTLRAIFCRSTAFLAGVSRSTSLGISALAPPCASSRAAIIEINRFNLCSSSEPGFGVENFVVLDSATKPVCFHPLPCFM